MKQSTLLWWIEEAETARFCRLADEDPARATFMTIMAKPRPFDLRSLRRQLCLGDTGRRLSRITQLRPAD